MKRLEIFANVLLIVFAFLMKYEVSGFDLRISTTDPYNPSRRSGLLEFEQEEQWFRVCHHNWGESESRVACGQLGFPVAADTRQQRISSGRRAAQVRLSDVNCTGTESRLSECRHQITSSENVNGCESGSAVFLTCAVNKQNGTRGIRLRGGPLKGQGRVQVVSFGKWGSICSNKWDSAAANVACRQLGYGTAKIFHKSTEFGRGQGAIWYTNVTCLGTENTLDECKFDRVRNIGYYNAYNESGCSQYDIASVSCFVPDDGQRNMMRLTEGSERVGRVLVKFAENEPWSGVCSEHWTLREATVVCRQLGLGFASRAIRSIGFARQGALGTSSTVAQVECNGDEQSLRECKHRKVDRGMWVNCGTQFRYSVFHAGVVCTNVLPDLQLDVDSLQSSVRLRQRAIKDLQCAASEGCLSSSANEFLNDTQHQNTIRQLLTFTTSAWNRGTADFRPQQNSDQWEFHECHNHYHSMQQFSHYDLLSATSFEKIAEGHKASFCLGDSRCDNFATRRYFCTTKPTKNAQGISVGCTDIYIRLLDCQWIDISDVPFGNYILRVSVNPLEQVAESDFLNNHVVCDLTYTKIRVTADNCRIPDDFSLSSL